MTFYKKEFGRNVLYEAPDNKVYKIKTYTEEYPDGRTEKVTGTIKRVDNKTRFDGVDSDDFEPVDRENISSPVIGTLQRKLSKEQAP